MTDVKGNSQQGYLWVYSRPKSDVLFEWRISRSREGPRELLNKFKGKLQADGYGAYESLLGSCRRHGVNPFDYLKDLFTRLPAAKITQIKVFTPAEWAKAKAKENLFTKATKLYIEKRDCKSET